MTDSVDTMSVDEFREYQRTGRLPARLAKKTRMEILAAITEADPGLAEPLELRRPGVSSTTARHEGRRAKALEELQAEAAANPERKRKYGNTPVKADGFVFDSKAEHRRYQELRLMEDAGEIADLEVHPRYTLRVNDMDISRYTPDFQYTDMYTNQLVVEDVKGGRATKTQAYIMRRKLMKALFDIDVQEVGG